MRRSRGAVPKLSDARILFRAIPISPSKYSRQRCEQFYDRLYSTRWNFYRPDKIPFLPSNLYNLDVTDKGRANLNKVCTLATRSGFFTCTACPFEWLNFFGSPLSADRISYLQSRVSRVIAARVRLRGTPFLARSQRVRSACKSARNRSGSIAVYKRRSSARYV